MLRQKQKKGKIHFLITTGGTREYIDPVRFLSNASSGKTGISLAEAALKAGHRVTLIAAAIWRDLPEGAKVLKVETASEMFAAVRKHFRVCDCLIMAAAVSDYTPVRVSKSKIKKTEKSLTIRLRPTPDILSWAAKHKEKKQMVVGFALEDKDIRRRAEKKLKEKGLDMIIANTPAAIGVDKAAVEIKMPGRNWLRLPYAAKTVIAERIISLASREMP
jgi:phosphopantothenoylcysteine synthetase/decarboxylase